MRRIVLLLTVFLVAFIAINRQRIFLRDPLGKVYRNEVKQDGAWVFINYSNDVLVESSEFPHAPQFLVQNWDKLPGVPLEMTCLLNVACMAQKDHEPMQSWNGARTAVMTNREVSFVDGDGTHVRVTLR
jgi:hypothetical protein